MKNKIAALTLAALVTMTLLPAAALADTPDTDPADVPPADPAAGPADTEPGSGGTPDTDPADVPPADPGTDPAGTPDSNDGGSDTGDGNVHTVTFTDGDTVLAVIQVADGETLTELPQQNAAGGAVKAWVIGDTAYAAVSAAEAAGPVTQDTVFTVWHSPLLESQQHTAYTAGMGNGRFNPYGTLTRGQAVQMLYSLLSDQTAGPLSAEFTDVTDELWCAQAVRAAASDGIISGYADGTFRAGTNVTRAQFVTMLVNLYGLPAGDATYTDTVGHWAENAISAAASKGWICGFADGTFHPDETITRAQATVILNRVLGRSADTACLSEGAVNPFYDVPEDAWYRDAVLEAATSHEYTVTDGKETWTSFTYNDSLLTSPGTGYHVMGGALRCIDENGQFVPVTADGWVTVDGARYYLRDGVPATGWLRDNGNTYYLDSAGRACTGWTQIGSDRYYFDEDGVMARSCRVDGYWMNADGTRSDYYRIQTSIDLPSGGYDLSTANIGLKVIRVNQKLLGTSSPRYTSYTASAVQNFQSRNGLRCTGTVSLDTWLAMGYSEYDWYHLGTYTTPIAVSQNATSAECVSAMLATAASYVGTTYAEGCSGTPGTYVDCSGLIYQCLYSAGINPDTNIVDHALAKYEYTSMYLAKDSKLGVTVSRYDMQPGDLIFFNRSTRADTDGWVGHVGIYAGNGMMYDAYPGIGVTKRSVSISGYYIHKVVRVFQ